MYTILEISIKSFSSCLCSECIITTSCEYSKCNRIKTHKNCAFIITCFIYIRMPRGKLLTNEEKTSIGVYKDMKFSNRIIAKQINRSYTVINNYVNFIKWI